MESCKTCTKLNITTYKSSNINCCIHLNVFRSSYFNFLIVLKHDISKFVYKSDKRIKIPLKEECVSEMEMELKSDHSEELFKKSNKIIFLSDEFGAQIN